MYILFVLDRNMRYIKLCANKRLYTNERDFFKRQWNIENKVIVIMKHLDMNQISALYNTQQVDMP